MVSNAAISDSSTETARGDWWAKASLEPLVVLQANNSAKGTGWWSQVQWLLSL